MLMPKRVKHRKQFRGSMAGKATRGNKITNGEYGIVALEPCWIKANQIEAARVAMTRYIKRGGKVWIKIFPEKPVTHKPMGVRMGKGKGALEYWVCYLRIEGAFYIGIGWLFLLYGLYRALGRPGMSVVLTVFSLGTRVALAYILSAIQAIGVVGIWWSIPIGWALADIVGLLYYKIKKQNLVEKEPEM